MFQLLFAADPFSYFDPLIDVASTLTRLTISGDVEVFPPIASLHVLQTLTLLDMRCIRRPEVEGGPVSYGSLDIGQQLRRHPSLKTIYFGEWCVGCQ